MTDLPPHGTYARYFTHYCRCDDCRGHQRQRVAESRAKRLAEGRVKHGNPGWDDGCRCEVCRAAHQERHREYALRSYQAGKR